MILSITVLHLVLLVQKSTAFTVNNGTSCNCVDNKDIHVPIVMQNVTQFCQYLGNGRILCCDHVKIVNVGTTLHLNCSAGEWEQKVKRIKNLDLSKSGIERFSELQNYDVFSNLQILDLSENRNLDLESLSGSPLARNLRVLKLGNVNVGSFQKLSRILSKADQLEDLDLSSCQLGSVDFKLMTNNKKLKKLNLSQNKILNVTFNQEILSELVTLNMSKCDLESLFWEGQRGPSPPATPLQVIDLSDNLLKKLPDFFVRPLKDVRFLYLKGNPIDTETCSFYYLWKLWFTSDSASTRLEADFDWLSTSRPRLFSCTWAECPVECDCFPHNKTLDCSHRGLETAPEIGPSEVETLLLQGNALAPKGIWFLFEMESWCQLKTVNLEGNGLRQITLENTNLRGKCHCSYGSDSTNCLLPNLSSLLLGHNFFSSFTPNDWKLVQKCARIDMSNNSLSEDSFQSGDSHYLSYSEGRFLNLSSNAITTFSMDQVNLFPFLETLDLSHNKLRKVDVAFTSLTPQLQVLDLSYNNIETLFPTHELTPEDEPFSSSFPEVKVVRLSGNQLTEVNPLLWKRLDEIRLDGNPWACTEQSVAKMQYLLWKNLAPKVTKAFQSLKCGNGKLLRNFHIPWEDETLEEANLKNKKPSIVFKTKLFALVSCTIGFVVFFAFFVSPLKTYVKNCYVKWKRRESIEFSVREKDLFVFFCEEDFGRFQEELLPDFNRIGCSIISPPDFIFGNQNVVQITEAICNSKKMLIIISRHFWEYQMADFVLRQGIEENAYEPRFKIACLHLDDAPTPENVYMCSTTRNFLECQSLRHDARDRWYRNLDKFLQI